MGHHLSHRLGHQQSVAELLEANHQAALQLPDMRHPGVQGFAAGAVGSPIAADGDDHGTAIYQPVQ